ncbi:MAG: class I SAM-dependent methyltransferase [Candidatus Micrarchaeota archaeon]|nr:class I SAM-dependent methyltransferase [Candidatus Micrarchaeota archaeon]
MPRAPPVKKVYDKIAADWAVRRRNPTKPVRQFMPLVPRGCVVLDAGCGNGRNIPPIAEKARRVYAMDFSEKMLEEAGKLVREKKLGGKVTLVRGDVRRLPLKAGSVDAVFSMAVVHHLKTVAGRKKAFREMHRVLKKGGLAFVTAWNARQKRFEKLSGRDAFVPWTTAEGLKVGRYYHFFHPEELRALARGAGFKVADFFFELDGLRHAEQGAEDLCMVLKKK